MPTSVKGDLRGSTATSDLVCLLFAGPMPLARFFSVFVFVFLSFPFFSTTVTQLEKLINLN